MPVIGQGDKDKIISFEISIIRNLVITLMCVIRYCDHTDVCDKISVVS